MANKITNTQHYQDIANAIRIKNGSADTYTPAQMAQAIEDLPSDTLRKAMKGELTGEVVIDYGNRDYPTPGVVINFRSNANTGITKIRYICKEGAQEQTKNPIATNSYDAGYALSEIDFGNLESTWFGLGNMQYGSWKNLTKVTAPRLKRNSNTWGYFIKGAAIEEANFPALETIPYQGFSECRQLKTVNMPAATSFSNGTEAFRNCVSLVNVSMPEMLEIGPSSFQGCTALTEFVLPKAHAGYSYTFADCTSLDIVDLGGDGGVIGTGTFRGCTLSALVLRSSTMVTLSNTNAFQNAGIETGTGYIYVPRNLISTYEAATNWSNFSNQFRAIEDYTNDGTLTGKFIKPEA